MYHIITYKTAGQSLWQLSSNQLRKKDSAPTSSFSYLIGLKASGLHKHDNREESSAALWNFPYLRPASAIRLPVYIFPPGGNPLLVRAGARCSTAIHPWRRVPPSLPDEITTSHNHRYKKYCTELRLWNTEPARSPSYGYGDRLTKLISDEIENEFSFFTFLSLFSASNTEKKETDYKITERGMVWV